MFKNRALQVKMVKTPTDMQEDPIVECDHLDLEKIDEILKEQVKRTAIAIVCVIGAATVMHTVSEIIINAAKPKKE